LNSVDGDLATYQKDEKGDGGPQKLFSEWNLVKLRLSIAIEIERRDIVSDIVQKKNAKPFTGLFQR
jgi:hypothetical protein